MGERETGGSCALGWGGYTVGSSSVGEMYIIIVIDD